LTVADPKVDPVTNTDTTGHEWDGISELDTPLPRWWLWVLYATIIWAVGYWIVMPAWPTISGYTTGFLGYSQRQVVTDQMAEVEASRGEIGVKLLAASLDEAIADPELLEFAMAGGRSSFLVNCSQCHGTGASGSPGYPNLNDDDWLWGGTVEDISQTISYGIRAEHDETRFSQMPAFLVDEMLTAAEIDDVAEYVLSLSGKETDAAAAERGEEPFVDWCTACHGESGEGMVDFGAPNLANAIWLYGSDKETIVKTISYSRSGMMPAWEDRLGALTVKQLAVYIHSLGGGQ
jgi:cytochrome c oxidase cbb3-type subunit 3